MVCNVLFSGSTLVSGADVEHKVPDLFTLVIQEDGLWEVSATGEAGTPSFVTLSL